MTKVFIGGSRRISRLGAGIRERLDRIVDKNLAVIIGDANGADKAVQSYLHKRGFTNVEVFCSGSFARNNLGQWPLRTVHVTSDRRDLDFYATKDRELAREATVGLMIWDGTSIGTLLNVSRLVRLKKCVLVFDVPAKIHWELKNEYHWREFVSCRGSELRAELERRTRVEDEMANDAAAGNPQVRLPL